MNQTVLEQVMSLQSEISAQSDHELLPYVSAKLSKVAGVNCASFSNKSTNSPYAWQYKLAENNYLHLQINSFDDFSPYASYVENFCALLSTLLEQRQQQHELQLQLEQSQHQLNLQHQKSQLYLDTAGVMLLALDTHGRITMLNKKGQQMMGVNEQDIIGENWFDYFAPKELKAQLYSEFAIASAMDERQFKEWITQKPHYESDIISFTGQRLSMEWRVNRIADQQQHTLGLLYSAENITARKRNEERIKTLAFFDQLTGLPNRTLLLDRLQQTISINARSNRYAAMIVIDLDNFKTLNDNHGYSMGDQLLIKVGKRLKKLVRTSDTVARLGGDEFVIILHRLSTHQSTALITAEAIGNKILEALNQGFNLGIGNIHCECRASLGIALFTGQRIGVDELFKQADLAMYESKQGGRNQVRFFDPELDKLLQQRIAVERNLRYAIDRQQFELFYQPQVNATGDITGAEALLRWHHPEQGLLSPFHFISIAEDSNLIIPIGKWILTTACEQLLEWNKHSQTKMLTISVNISAQQLHQDNFAEQVLETLKQTGADPEKLKLELTESHLVDNIEKQIPKMEKLKQHGIGFELDDFGTGYSSLSYLKKLPLEQLKIDRSFVSDLPDDNNSAVIAKTIIVLSQALGLNVIAEGVETKAQQQFLLEAGCPAFQGWLYHPAMPLSKLELILKNN